MRSLCQNQEVQRFQIRVEVSNALELKFFPVESPEDIFVTGMCDILLKPRKALA